MNHTVQVKLIGNEIINYGWNKANLKDIESIELEDNFKVKKVNFKSNRGEKK